MVVFAVALMPAAQLPVSPSGTAVHYRLASPSSKPSVVREFTLAYEESWIGLHAVKNDGTMFDLWLLHPQAPERYILREGSAQPEEYRHIVTGGAVLPSAINLSELLPQTIPGGIDVMYLGHRYSAGKAVANTWSLPGAVHTVMLWPDLLIGPASNARTKNDTRHWDGTDYEMTRLMLDDYRQMALSGINCVRVDDEQAGWAHDLGLFYWGAGQKLPYPEMLYRPQYLGPVLFLDEPAVSTRDHKLRPRLSKDQSFRESIHPQDALAAFESYYSGVLDHGPAVQLQALLGARSDVDLGSLTLVQENLFSWETMISTAAYQLTRRPSVPEAFVFEPPGRIGSIRTLPELNMTAGTQYSTGDAGALADLIFGFLRGAARLSGKNWGVSIYGAVERADAYYWLTRAYDLGATHFHFWDNYRLACVPFGEYLAMARHLRDHAASHPLRDLDRLKHAAEVAITLPPGYDLGHTQMGRGNLWGLGELNLERRNSFGVTYRTVMSNFHYEAERSIRRGIPFDALWELSGHPPLGYREVVHIREDGRVAVDSAGRNRLLSTARRADPKPGAAPQLSVEVQSRKAESVLDITAIARVHETTAPVYYTHGADAEGIYRNAMVMWELYGPGKEDYRLLMPEGMRPTVRRHGTDAEVEMVFHLDRPGIYRLRAATVDTDGRSQVVWRTLDAR